MSYSVVTDYRTTLAAPMTSSQLTVVVNSIVTKDATPHTITTSDLGDGWYLTLEPGGANEEIVKVTAVTAGSGDGGTFTVPADGRGLAFYGTTDAQGAGNAKAHNPGAVVILSNVKNVYDRLVDKETNETIDGVKTFLEVPVIPPVPTSPTDAASKAYVDATVMAAGGVTAGYVTQNGADPSLTINVGSGEFIFGGTVVSFAGASAQAVTAASTNYVQLRNDGTLIINTTGFLGGHIPLAAVTTDGTDITSILDERPFFTQPETVQLVTTALTYGATIAAGDKLYLDSADGKWKLALATTSATADSLFGIALDAGVNNDTLKRVQIGGLVTVLSGLTPGFQYLTDLGALSTTPGTYRKLVGFAPTATKLVLMTGIRPNDLSGVDSSVTATILNEAGAFFATTKRQSIKYTATAGQALAAGEVVTISTDGNVYRANVTGFSTANAGTATTLGSTELGSQSKMYWFDTATPTIKSFLGHDQDVGTDGLKALRVTTDANYNAISSTATGAPSPTVSPSYYDAILHNGDTQVTIAYGNGASYEAVSYNDLAGTPSPGSAIVLDAAGTGSAITDTASAGILVAFGGTNAQADLTSFKITFSGTALTESTNATLVSGGTSINPYAAGRFTGTNFIAVLYTDNSVGKIIIAEYNPTTGGWTTIGTPVNIGAGSAFLSPLSSTAMAVLVDSGTDLVAYTVTRSGVVATVSSPLAVVNGANAQAITFKKLGKYTFMAGCETTAGGVLQLIATDRDFTGFSLIGSAITNDSVDNRAIAGCLLTPNRWLAIYQDSNTTTSINTRQLTTNFNSTIGVIEAAVASSGTEDVITHGYSNSFTGLTAGTAYYTTLDGQLTSSAVGTGVFTSATETQEPVKRIVIAQSATEGIVTL
jgi:hypothetical protein